ncbi:TVP38/TMEM64 family protein [Planococcus halotolerans]|uniref:TVP38/TMEM64 family membrane protein n=1 Tax=Planococcus halotolerans TaxID=2233542 RepID=A0A365KYZ7_9BACL|nr:VTT domain-containing protein [Planococcus halotolerans]QHJ72045.1 TVP38/TMEM64 family protein [Planococcus halotolerans]RAZ77937.1 TVP38/TMEM64 family protein [Planococcus halotolerans]
MDQFDKSVELFIENAGWMAPFFFLILHLIRPFVFLPVVAVCIVGGVAFGFVQGTILSYIGLMLMSAIIYFLLKRLPKFHRKMTNLKERIFPDRTLSVGQVMLLRIMPFVHFQLLCFYLMDMTKSFKEYMYYSAIGLTLPAVVYTAFGQSITEFPWYMTIAFLFVLIALFLVIEKYNKVRTVHQEN